MLSSRRTASPPYLAAAILCGGVLALHGVLWHRDRALARRLSSERNRISGGDAPPFRGAGPKVTVLVAAWNEAGTIGSHLQSVRRLRYRRVEHILCCGGLDGTYDIARGFCAGGDGSVRVLEQLPGEGKQRALCRAYELATGGVVFLTDADCVVDDLSFESTLAPILSGEEVATSGGCMPFPGRLSEDPFVFYQWAVQHFAAMHAGRYLEALLGRNAAVLRTALDSAGAFDTNVPTGTDYDLGRRLRRLGYRIRHVPHSLVRTHYPVTIGAYARQQRRWLRNVMLIGMLSGARSEAARALLTSFVGAVMLAGPLVGPRLGGWPAVLWLAAFLYSALAKVRYALFSRVLLPRDVGGRSPAMAPILALAPVMTLVEYGIWVLPVLDYVSSRGRRAW